MKLLLFINSLTAGGAERVLAKLGDYFVEQGHDVTLLTQTETITDHYPTRAARLSLSAGSVSRNPLHALMNNLTRLRRLRACIRDLEPDCVVAFMPTANVLALMAAGPTPVIVSERVHPPFLELSTARRWMQRRFYPRAARVIVLSEASARWFAETYSFDNVAVIPNSISLPLPVHDPQVQPRDVLPDDVKVVLCVGRLVEQKRPELVLRAFANVSDPDWRLVMIGSGTRADEIKQLAAALGIESRFELLARVGNIETWYKRAEVYVSASSYEGFPNSLLEAMACGCAALVFDCPTGPADLIEHEDNGLLVPMDKPDQFAVYLQELCRDTGLRERLGNNARNVAARFSDQAVLPRWTAAIEEAVR